MPKSDAEATVDQVLREHEELRGAIEELREFVAAPQPEIGEEGHEVWAASMSGRVAKLHAMVSSHFRREDREGVLEELSHRHPRASKQIEALQEEHEEVLGSIRDLMMDTLSFSEGKTPKDAKLSGRLGGILDRLENHERVETDLITRVEYEDVGGAE